MEGKPLYGQGKDKVLVHRGVSSKYPQKRLRHGDFVSTNRERANQYKYGKGKVLSFHVPQHKLVVADPEAKKLGLHTQHDYIYKSK